MPTPTWTGASTGSAPLANQINQFLGTHAITPLYAAAAHDAQTTNGSAHTSTNGTWLAQKITMGSSQTAIGYVTVPVTTTQTSGSALAPTTISIYSDNSSNPGSSLVGTTFAAEYAYSVSGGTDTVFVTYPVPITGLTANGAYWIVVTAAGTSSTISYQWRQSNQTSGGRTSTNGTSWTSPGYGFMYTVYDQAPTGVLTATWEDSGARWSANTWTAQNQLSTKGVYTSGQTASGYTQSFRTFSYSNGLMTGGS